MNHDHQIDVGEVEAIYDALIALRGQIDTQLAYIKITASKGNPDSDIREVQAQLESAHRELSGQTDTLLTLTRDLIGG